MRFAGVELEVGPGWLDITSDLAQGGPPTLAKSDGVGVLQFSVGRYAGGVVPDMRVAQLRGFLSAFAGAHPDLGSASNVREGASTSALLSMSADFAEQGAFTRVWYLTNGRDVAFVTYTGDGAEALAELDDCEMMVRSIEL